MRERFNYSLIGLGPGLSRILHIFFSKVKYYLLLYLFTMSMGLFWGTENLPAQNILTRNTLTGNWYGLRNDLTRKGIDFEFVYTGQSFFNLTGGLHRKGVYLDNVDLISIVNLDRLLSLQGATFFVYGLGNQGGNPNRNVGDAQDVSNIAAPSTWRLYEVWLQQNILRYETSILLGFYDLNSEFDRLHSASLFLNASHGIDPTFSQSGVAGPSIFPNTTLGLRLKWIPDPNFYLQTVLLNGIAGNPGSPGGIHIKFSKTDGILSTTEAAFILQPVVYAAISSGRKRRRHIGRLADPDYQGKIGVGFWIYTAPFNILLPPTNPQTRQKTNGNLGIYLIAEYTIYREKDNPAQNIMLFARIGYANSKINRFGSYCGGGIVYAGPIPGRDNDQAGFAVAGVYNGKEYESFKRRQGEPVNQAEWNLELTYQARILSWFILQPDLQYVIHPNTDPVVNNALAFAVSAEVFF
jgi:porin